MKNQEQYEEVGDYSSGTCSPEEDFIDLNVDDKSQIDQNIINENIPNPLLSIPIRLQDFIKTDNIYAQFLIDIAQRCLQFEQGDRPNVFMVWKKIEEFE